MRRFFALLFFIMCATHISCREADKYSGVWLLGEPMIFRNSICSINADSFCGSTIEYRNNEIVVNGKILTIKSKQVENWDSIRLRNETRASHFKGVTFEDLGIEEKEITVVTLETDPCFDLPGTLFFIIDDFNMITMVGNVYYRMKRITAIM